MAWWNRGARPRQAISPTSVEPPQTGDGRSAIKRHTGEVPVRPSLPIYNGSETFSEQIPQTPRPQSGDPLCRAEHEPRRTPYPATVTQLTVAGRVWTATSAKGNGEPAHHPFVGAFYAAMPAAYKERGCDRASEAVVLSDALLAEDADRARAGQPPLTVSEARDDFLRGADVFTYAVREPGDPADGRRTAPTVPSMMLLHYLGFTLAPRDTTGSSAGSAP
jgi:YwqJ-like deaminase